MHSKYLALCLSLSVFPLTGWAFPPPVPSAGVVERELEKEYEAQPLERDREVPAIQIDIPEEKLEMADGQSIWVGCIEIRGNSAISSKDILDWIQQCYNRDLSLKEIYGICQKIDHHYAERGYFLARTYPPPQTIENGKLVLEVIEGKLGHIEVVGNQFYKESFIRSYFAGLQDKPLQYDKFVRALMLLNENSDLVAGAVFEKGREFGYADVIIRVNDARPVHLYANGNNYGRNLTTNARAGGRLDWGNLAFSGDQLSVAEVVGFPVDALYFTDVVYTVPLNRNGTDLELAYLYSRFKIEELKSLHLKGMSQIGTVKINHALIRKRFWNLDLFGYFDYKQIGNYELGHRVSFDKLRVLTIGTLLDHYSKEGGRDYLNVRVAAGIPNFLGGLKAVDSECSRPGGGGRFFMLNADYDRIQPLPKSCYFYFHGSGQLSPSKLTLPEQIYIGGSDTVRGFPLAIALGDNGYYLNFEVRVPPPLVANKKLREIFQFDAFLDHGGVFLQSAQNTFLWGTGLGVRINGPLNLCFGIDVGFPLNHRSQTKDVFTYIKITGQPF